MYDPACETWNGKAERVLLVPVNGEGWGETRSSLCSQSCQSFQLLENRYMYFFHGAALNCLFPEWIPAVSSPPPLQSMLLFQKNYTEHVGSQACLVMSLNFREGDSTMCLGKQPFIYLPWVFFSPDSQESPRFHLDIWKKVARAEQPCRDCLFCCCCD